MSAGPTLYLPNSVQPSGGWKAKSKQKPKRQSGWHLPPPDTGKRSGKPAGTHIDDLSAQAMAIWLCFQCRSKFDHERAHYFYEKNMRVRGNCDACKTFDVEAHLFIHESTLTDPGGKSRHGHVWTPRQGG